MTRDCLLLRRPGRCRLLAALAPLAAWSVSPQSMGAAAPLAESLAQRIDVTWSNSPVRPALTRLSAATGVAVLLDRRIDPHRPVELSARGETLGRVLQRAAQQIDAQAIAAGALVYIGPPRSAAVAPRLIAPPPLPATARRALRRSAPLQWPRLATPRSLAEQLATAQRLELANPEAIPHDLWNAGSLPPAAASEQLGWLLIGFDLTWRVDPAAPRRLIIEPVDFTQLAENGVARSRRPRPQRDGVTLREQRYTLRVRDQPLAAVLRQIAARTGHPLRIDPAAVVAAEGRVSFAVNQAPLVSLLEAAGDAAGLSVRVEGEVICVAPVRATTGP